MQKKTTKPNSIIYYYVFICVFIGCVETSMNQSIFEPLKLVKKEAKPAKQEPQPVIVSEPVEDAWDVCPDKERVLAFAQSFEKRLSETIAIVQSLQEKSVSVQQKELQTSINSWRENERAWTSRNEMLIANCSCLLSAHGVCTFPEIPLALENLKNAGTWLGWSIECAQAGKDTTARAYIASARLATKRARNLINGRVKPRAKTALVKLPKYLERKQVVAGKQPKRPKQVQEPEFDLSVPAGYRIISY